MTTPRLIVSDVDRTLLTHDYVLPQRVADAVRAAQDRGTVVVLATARSPLGVRPFAERLGIADLVVAFNGGWIGNVATGSTLSQQRISRSDALHAMATAQAAGARPMWFTGDAVFALMNDPLIAREAAVTREPLFVAETIEALPGEPGKIMCVAGQASDREAFALLRETLGGRLSVSGSHPRLLEIGPPGASKKTAISLVAAKLGIAADECAAAGDAENDVEMLAWAGTAMTVGNAVPQVMQLAHFVGPSCDEGGLADAIAWLMRSQQPRSTAAQLMGGRDG
ncbi:HAD family hydrolase [Mesorhizobium sp. M2E.F.Ca.ET.209.01.1.1]|uniref:Cof-type HAD-IIB family hydrolase n=1 Tax=Mesorhizobium sp. M2E.F.Ca.ET.209.01.1.1 TaxID=2500526 RepID=UPI000FDBE5DC|nr:Cof-type HAD-IIB family hydrolase [Mesorhizobium sp. M2E.F.Ca.ET.209.01.1.1]TGS17817.1 HAD family hydrolase [Mesorhizobium sp. M2E.F.Ca.ET.209.01.1.1]